MNAILHTNLRTSYGDGLLYPSGYSKREGSAWNGLANPFRAAWRRASLAPKADENSSMFDLGRNYRCDCGRLKTLPLGREVSGTGWRDLIATV